MTLKGVKPSKFYIRKYLVDQINSANGREINCLDLGCGTATLFEPLIKNYPHFKYYGLEPDPASARAAQELYQGLENCHIQQGLAYGDTQSHNLAEKFDIVVSLSVLEHVKDLKSFLDFSVRCVKPGGQIIHLYDLGHSLYPHNFKAKVQAILSNSPFTRRLLPENKIAGYVHLAEVKKTLEGQGVKVERISYHNMRSHVDYLKKITTEISEELLDEIASREVAWAEKFGSEGLSKELIFPAVAVWATKP